MKKILFLILCFTLLAQAAGCGKKSEDQSASKKNGEKSQKAQSQNEQDSGKPIDTELRSQMQMYKNIKQYEYEEAEKQRKLDKEQLKKLQKEKQQSAKQQSGGSSESSGGEKDKEEDKQKEESKDSAGKNKSDQTKGGSK